MKNGTQLLIEELLLEEEKLQQELQACVQEWDFESAEALRKAITYTRERLTILQNLENPDHDRITSLKASIERTKARATSEKDSPYWLWYLKKKLSEEEAELSALEKKTRKQYLDSDELILCFERLLASEIDHFEILIESVGLVFDWSKEVSVLKIVISKTDDNQLLYTTSGSGWLELKKMGFELKDGIATKEFLNSRHFSPLKLLELFSRIIFEGFHLHGNHSAKLRW